MEDRARYLKNKLEKKREENKVEDECKFNILILSICTLQCTAVAMVAVLFDFWKTRKIQFYNYLKFVELYTNTHTYINLELSPSL